MRMQSSSSISFEQLQQLICCVYDAALEPGLWGNVLEKLTHTLKAEQANMRIINTELNDMQLAYCYNKDPHWNQIYKEYYIHKDLWLNDMLKDKKTFIACTHHYITNKAYEMLEFHRDFVSPQKVHYGMGGKIDLGENITGFLTLSRDRNKQGFENEYYETLLKLAPHLQKSLLVNKKTRHLELKQNLLRDALNQINSPLLLVDKNGNILFINSQAEQLIEQQSGISIKNNHLFILSDTDNIKLQKLIHQATHTDSHNLLRQGGAMQYTDPATQSSLSILVSPVNPDRVNIDTQGSENALLVLSTHHHQQPLSVELLSALYKLTPAEARLTMQICLGLTLDEISVIFCLSKNTLKTQLRSTFNKTNVSRQAELIRLINAGPAGIIKTT